VPRKQPSGAANRKRREAKLKASGQLMPPAPALDQLTSLSGIIREKARNYRDWKQGRITAETYWTSIRGLSALAAAITARESERQREIDEQVLAKLEAFEGGQGLAVEYTTAAPVVGELMPRTAEDNERNE
jgi:hypothetical protein